MGPSSRLHYQAASVQIVMITHTHAWYLRFMDAGKVVDAYGCMKKTMCSRLMQSKRTFKVSFGTETCVELPKEAWPDDWWKWEGNERVPKHERPVVRLLKALYGHPDSGTFWEKHCGRKLREMGLNLLRIGRQCIIAVSLNCF